MKSRRLHVLALFAVGIVACKTGGGSNGTKSPSAAGVSIDPATTVGEMDGQKITYGDLQSDKEIGPKLTQAEVKALTDLYNTRRGLLEQLVSTRLLEAQAKAKGKSLDDWFKTDYADSVPAPTEDENKAFFEEHKAQVQGRSYDELKPQIAQAVKQQKMRDNMDKMLASLKEQHKVTTAMLAPELPRIKVDAKGPSRGPDAATVTIVEFSDFQCPFCGREFPVVEKVMKEYDGKVKLVFRNYPLEFHPFAAKAAEAAACANDQGKFWELHNKMFTNQEKLAVDDLKGYAKGLGMDSAKFDKCLDSGEKKGSVTDDQKAGSEAGVNGTPAFFVNGIFINGAQPYEEFKATIDRELAKKG